MSAARVKPHTRRTKSGKRVKVKPYSRHLKPGRASKNLRNGNRALRRRQYGKAAVLATAATAEIGGWLLARGTGVALTSLGIVLVGAGVAARRSAR